MLYQISTNNQSHTPADSHGPNCSPLGWECSPKGATTSSTLGKGENKLGGLLAISSTDPNFIRYGQYGIELIKTYYTSIVTLH